MTGRFGNASQAELLDKAVEDGKITEDQVEQYLKWLESKPDTPQFSEQLKEWQLARPDLP